MQNFKFNYSRFPGTLEWTFCKFEFNWVRLRGFLQLVQLQTGSDLAVFEGQVWQVINSWWFFDNMDKKFHLHIVYICNKLELSWVQLDLAQLGLGFAISWVKIQICLRLVLRKRRVEQIRYHHTSQIQWKKVSGGLGWSGVGWTPTRFSVSSEPNFGFG